MKSPLRKLSTVIRFGLLKTQIQKTTKSHEIQRNYGPFLSTLTVITIPTFLILNNGPLIPFGTFVPSPFFEFLLDLLFLMSRLDRFFELPTGNKLFGRLGCLSHVGARGMELKVQVNI
jgi:hypothetical protein